MYTYRGDILLDSTIIFYYPQCVTSGLGDMFPGDVVDNDCDGRVDEELNNGIGIGIYI